MDASRRREREKEGNEAGTRWREFQLGVRIPGGRLFGVRVPCHSAPTQMSDRVCFSRRLLLVEVGTRSGTTQQPLHALDQLVEGASCGLVWHNHRRCGGDDETTAARAEGRQRWCLGAALAEKGVGEQEGLTASELHARFAQRFDGESIEVLTHVADGADDVPTTSTRVAAAAAAALAMDTGEDIKAANHEPPFKGVLLHVSGEHALAWADAFLADLGSLCVGAGLYQQCCVCAIFSPPSNGTPLPFPVPSSRPMWLPHDLRQSYMFEDETDEPSTNVETYVSPFARRMDDACRRDDVKTVAQLLSAPVNHQNVGCELSLRAKQLLNDLAYKLCLIGKYGD